MKLLKLFGLVALVALMAMVFVGTGSAMATSTALCVDMPVEDGEDLADEVDIGTDAEDVEDGACIDLVTHVHETTLSGAPGKLLSIAITFECDVLFLGDVLGLGNPQAIHTGKFTYTNCNNECVVTQEGTALLSVLRISHETAEVTGEGKVHIECGIFIDCKYTGAGLVGTGKGPLLASHLNGEVSISEQTTKGSGVFCPTKGKLDITLTPLTHTYIGL